MKELYPKSLPAAITIRPLDPRLVTRLVRQLPRDLLVHIHGLRLVGKSQLSKRLSAVLAADIIDEVLITRSIAWAITEDATAYDRHDFKPYFSQLSFEKTEAGLLPIFAKKRITTDQLQQKKVIALSQKLEENQKYDSALAKYTSDALEELKGRRIVYVSFSPLPKSFVDHKSLPKVVEHILLVCSEEKLFERFVQQEKAQLGVVDDSGAKESVAYEQSYEKSVLEYNEVLIEKQFATGGLVCEHDTVVDTTGASEDQVVTSILAYWKDLV